MAGSIQRSILIPIASFKAVSVSAYVKRKREHAYHIFPVIKHVHKTVFTIVKIVVGSVKDITRFSWMVCTIDAIPKPGSMLSYRNFDRGYGRLT